MTAPGRYRAAHSPGVAEGWQLDRITPPSRLFGANGLRTGPDGRLYVAQVTGSQISAMDTTSGALDVVSAKGGEIIGPDDLAFDEHGNMFATEVMDGRVSALDRRGQARVLRDDIPLANGITVFRDRLFVGECREGGRLLELDRNGGTPRVLLENVPMPNAMEVGPDGLLYFPVMGANEIWRIDPDGGRPETVAADLGVPDSVKFDAEGYIVSTQLHSGQVLRINPRNGERTVLAELDPGLDNLSFVDQRLFVSSLNGQITEILEGGKASPLLSGGLNWPLDLAVADDGNLYIADGIYFYRLAADGQLHTAGMLFAPGYPGFLRGLAPVGDGKFIVTTSNGQVARYRPADGESEVLADGFDQLYGVAVGPDGTAVVAELGTGGVLAIRSGEVRTLASGLQDPVGVTIGPDGTCLVTESATGRIVKITSSGAHTLAEGLHTPQGILVHDGQLFVVDAGAKAVIAFDTRTRDRHTIAFDLPLGAPPGVIAKPLRGMAPFSGPQGPFAGIAAGRDGTLYFSADGDGSVLALRRQNSDGGR
ncbi:SMP-30/gluconolactonase/LRE family protein [Mycobacterium branderi]|uniref:Gluconolaconase n=1 Tax=Mycobacterium branderi TaxID=43348 RepID=A0A7I7WDB0_9MYCO|nr:SMP-30/gluconolactonase/LRE family protein [Mycobacterium branderi]MCV7234643.1 SMP-30/gluconolactonase/LRE family protein [Mycobacterium branderi]ORA33179.1 gluconolaconase [Mycobacterium branderi]BBZ15434.1 gluconolaconase [Mycobacterium branderi]